MKSSKFRKITKIHWIWTILLWYHSDSCLSPKIQSKIMVFLFSQIDFFRQKSKNSKNSKIFLNLFFALITFLPHRYCGNEDGIHFIWTGFFFGKINPVCETGGTSSFKEAYFSRVIKVWQPIVSPVIRSGFRSASGFNSCLCGPLTFLLINKK